MNSKILDDAPATLFDVSAVIDRLWRRRLIIALVTFLAILAGFAYLSVTKPTYVATASILIDPRDIKSTNIDTVLPGIGADSAAITSQVSIILSRDLLHDVFTSLNLASEPEFAAGRGLMSSIFGGPTGPVEELQFEKFRGLISAQREGLTYVINVSVRLTDADKAARIANAVVERYIAGTRSDQSSATDLVNATLNDKIVALQNDVASAELAVERYKTENNIFDPTTGGTLQAQIDQTAGQLISAQDDLAQVQARLDQVQSIGASPSGADLLSDISASPEIGRLRDQYNAAAAALASASATLGPRHPTVVRAQAELASASRLLVTEANRYSRQLVADRDALQGKVDRLQQDLTNLRERGDVSNVAQIELRQLQARADASRTVLADFLQRSQETSQIGNIQSSWVQFISRAVAPLQPVWPKPSLILPVAGVMGFLLGCGVALVLAARPAPLVTTPAPQPEKPRSTRFSFPLFARKQPTPIAPPPKVRRYAELGPARQEIFSGRDTALTRAVQTLVRDIIGQLPPHPAPFIIAFSGPDAGHAMRIAAFGFARIGAEVHIEDVFNPRGTGGRSDFIFRLFDSSDESKPDLLVNVHHLGDPVPKTGNISFAVPAREPAGDALAAG